MKFLNFSIFLGHFRPPRAFVQHPAFNFYLCRVVSGVTYIDECVGPDSSAFYLGVFYTMAILGPALGYSIGGQFLNIHADFLRFFDSYFCSDFIKLTTGLLPRVHAHVLRTPRPFRLFNMQNGALRPPPLPPHPSQLR
jgi:hypothetical protein